MANKSMQNTSSRFLLKNLTTLGKADPGPLFCKTRSLFNLILQGVNGDKRMEAQQEMRMLQQGGDQV